MKPHNKKLVGELCNYLGEDLDHPMCQELLQHVNECPECREYIESVKLTVSLCKEFAPAESVPGEIQERLLHSLNLKK